MLSDLRAVERVLKKAHCPEHVFGSLDGADARAKHKLLSKAYHALATTVHPDKYAKDTAETRALSAEVFAELSKWKKRADDKVDAGTYGDGKPYEERHEAPVMSPQIIQTRKRKYIVTKLLAHGDLADVYECATTNDAGVEEKLAFKIARSPLDSDLVENEHKVLSAMYPAAQPPEKLYRYMPKSFDSFLLQTPGIGNRRVHVLQLFDEHVSLAEVMAAYPKGIDFRDMAWMFRRCLEGIGFVHKEKNVVHGAILPPHLLVHMVHHGAKFVDWCYAVPNWDAEKSHVKAISKAYRAYYAPEVLAKKPPTPETDLYMIAKCMVALLGGDVATNAMPAAVPKAVQNFLRSCLFEAPTRRPRDAWTLYDELDEVLRALVGERKYRPPLPMPNKM